jgi:DNA-directed RNA polymerase specialized sigma24 family protein
MRNVGEGTSRSGHAGFDGLPAIGQPSPELAVILKEELARLLTKLDNPALQQVAICKMEGYTNGEIAAEIGCSLATFERRLKLVRQIWSNEEW